MPSMDVVSHRRLFCRLQRGFLVGCLLGAEACAGSGTVTALPDPGTATTRFREGQIIDTAANRVVAFDQLMARILDQDVVYFGEEHHNRAHIEAALTVLQRLVADSRRPVVAMEMFGWDAQPALDQYVSIGEMQRPEFLEQVRWRHNWGGPFEDYEPLVQYARNQRLSLVAMNPPKSLVRSVAKQGIERARHDEEGEMVRWGMRDETLVEDPEYRSRILHQLRSCHDGGPDAMYQTMYEASMFRDEGMAKSVVLQVERLKQGIDRMAGPVVSYTGGGHVQYNLPVPKRVARRLVDSVRQLSIYMTSFEMERVDDIQEMIQGKIADYIWLTPVGHQGAPRRCR